MVVQYLSVCPLRGRDYVRALLPSLCAHSDRSARTVAQLLRDGAGWADEADAVLRARGMWWLARSLPPGVARSSEGDDARRDALQGSTLAKAAWFFQEAGDRARVSALLEASLSRCCWAVAAATQAFAGLGIHPAACGPYKALLPTLLDESRSQEDRLLELECALVEAAELLQAVDLDDNRVVDAVLHRCYRTLDTYVGAVQARFAPQPSAGVLRAAAARLAGLITEKSDFPTLPMRCGRS
jgi:hypothetical protein